MKNCFHIWEFMRDLLKSNSNLVEWINKKEGLFKIIKKDKLAKLWGKQKQRKYKTPMNYDKMSRGIRHARKMEFFKQIDKNKSYGVKLVLQFGPKAVLHCKWLKSFVKY